MFKPITAKPAEAPASKPPLQGVTEAAWLRIDKDVPEHFQEDGAGW